jgi:hypothetical protein
MVTQEEYSSATGGERLRGNTQEEERHGISEGHKVGVIGVV